MGPCGDALQRAITEEEDTTKCAEWVRRRQHVLYYVLLQVLY